MPVETALRIHLPHRPGELATVARHLTHAGVNIRSVAALPAGEEGTVELLVDDVPAATHALSWLGIHCKQVQIVVAPLATQLVGTPGALAELAEALAADGINIESLYTAHTSGGQPIAVLACSDPEKAEPILASWGGA